VDLAAEESEVTVQLVQVVDPAEPAQFNEPAEGSHLVGVQLEIVNVGSTKHSDSVDTSTFAIDEAGRQYPSTYLETKAGPGFGGTLDLGPGEKRVGFVTFELPDGATVAKVQVTADYGFADEWVELDAG
jgi:hypothetical protein